MVKDEDRDYDGREYERRLAAAREYARDALLKGDTFELVFHRRQGSGKKLTLDEILHDRHVLRRRLDPNFPSRQRMPEAEVEEIYLRAIRNNDIKAHCKLINEIIAYLIDSGLKLSDGRIKDVIEDYTIEALEKYRISILKKRGRKTEKNCVRDAIIAGLVEELNYHFEINPTRNREKKEKKERESACSIVAGVLREGGLPVTEQAVEKIWQRRMLWP